MRRNVSLCCLLLAWLCANGVVWNIVQVVAWARMFQAAAAEMSTADALQRTFDGSRPCELCNLAANGQEAARRDRPREALPGAGEEKILLLADSLADPFLAIPRHAWPRPEAVAVTSRTEPVPVRPPRA